MDLLIALLHVTAHIALAFAIVLPGFRRIGISILTAIAATTLFLGMGDEMRELTTFHHYAGFAGSDMEVSMVEFPTGTFRAEGGQWTIPYAAWTLLWIVVLWTMRRREAGNPWLLPTLFAWTSFAAWIGMQMLAAPSTVVQPIGLDRFLWPAGIALSLLAAKRARGLLTMFVMVGSGILLARVPAVAWSKYASANEMGTCLDIHSIRDIVNPMTQMQFEPRLEMGSSQQEFWLIWLEHVIFFPAVYLMSLFGIALGTYFFHKHNQLQATPVARPAASQPASPPAPE
ncbi:MAG: hypothetical protein AB8H80_12490 [Planctomycetota bacterium]